MRISIVDHQVPVYINHASVIAGGGKAIGSGGCGVELALPQGVELAAIVRVPRRETAASGTGIQGWPPGGRILRCARDLAVEIVHHPRQAAPVNPVIAAPAIVELADHPRRIVGESERAVGDDDGAAEAVASGKCQRARTGRGQAATACHRAADREGLAAGDRPSLGGAQGQVGVDRRALIGADGAGRPRPLLISVSALPSLPIVTVLVSLKVRLLTVIFAPSMTLPCCVAPLAENVTLVVEPGTRPVGVREPGSWTSCSGCRWRGPWRPVRRAATHRTSRPCPAAWPSRA